MHYARFYPQPLVGQLDEEEARHQRTLDAQRAAEERARQARERAARVARALEGQLRVVLPRTVPAERERRYDPVIPNPGPTPSPSPAPSAPPVANGSGDTRLGLPGPVASVAAKTIGQSILDVLIVTSPAWGAVILSRLLR
jgi:hypothetical protein